MGEGTDGGDRLVPPPPLSSPVEGEELASNPALTNPAVFLIIQFPVAWPVPVRLQVPSAGAGCHRRFKNFGLRLVPGTILPGWDSDVSFALGVRPSGTVIPRKRLLHFTSLDSTDTTHMGRHRGRGDTRKDDSTLRLRTTLPRGRLRSRTGT